MTTSTPPSPKEQARTEIEELMRDNLAQRAKNRDAARRRYARILRELTGEAAGDRVTTPERDSR